MDKNKKVSKILFSILMGMVIASGFHQPAAAIDKGACSIQIAKALGISVAAASVIVIAFISCGIIGWTPGGWLECGLVGTLGAIIVAADYCPVTGALHRCGAINDKDYRNLTGKYC